MLTLIVRRLLIAIPTLIAVTFLTLFFTTFMHPDAAEFQVRGNSQATEQDVIDKRHELGLDRPVVTRYVAWAKHAVRLDFGTSFNGARAPIRPDLLRRLPLTMSLAAMALLFGIAVGIPVGLLAGMRPGRASDRIGTGFMVLGVSVPSFVIAPILAMLFGVTFKIFPAQWDSFKHGTWQFFYQRILPCAVLAIGVAAAVARQLRGAIIDTLGSNYVRTAWATGARARTVIGKHALKNASIPAVTAIGLQLGVLVASTVFVELVFSIPALGSYLLPALTSADVPVLIAVTVVFVFVQLFIGLLLDILYGILNPKVRLS